MPPGPRRPALYLIAPLLALSCDDVTVGQLPEEPGPPVLMRLLIQDELPRGGHNVATDLLDKQPVRKCSFSDPCPTGDQYSHPLCNYTTGTCPDPLSPSETPATIGVPGTLGGDQFRFVFQKQLDHSIEAVMTDPMTGGVAGYQLKDESVIGLYDAQGRELPSVKYWDPTGSPLVTSDIFLNPLGPALVLKPKAAMVPLTSYSIHVKPELMKDIKGQAVAHDFNHDPVAAKYDFKTEGLHPVNAGPLVDYKGLIDPKDALVIYTNVRFVRSSLKVVVKKDGAPVETVAAPDFGTDPNKCDSVALNSLQINVFRVSGDTRLDWAEGDYTVSIDAVSTDQALATFSISPFGDKPYKDVPFSVKAGTDKDKKYLAEMLLLPGECASSPPGDMAGIGGDLAAPADMAVPTLDMSAPVDGGAGN